MPRRSEAEAQPARGRRVRDVAAVVLIAGLCLGTFVWQTDDTWPFAQMRMFPGSGESEISYVAIEATFVDGNKRRLSSFAFHLKRADIEGQMKRIRARPAMLGDLIDTYNAHVRHDREIARLRLVKREAQRGQRAAGENWVETELARWPG